jgi:DNA-binding CsgD family transcriptional regulator
MTQGRPEDLPLNVGHGPGSTITPAARQAVLDAAAVLQMRRSEAAAQAARGELNGIEVVAVGMKAIQEWLGRGSESWHEVLSVRPTATTTQLRASLPHNRSWYRQGISMVSVFDYYGTSAEARMLLANETIGDYLFGCATVQMKVIDRRSVLLQGPEVDGFDSLMSVSAPGCMDAAWRYWEAVLASCAPAGSPTGRPLDDFTRRQRQVIALLSSDLGDEAIAASLDVSVRTVRADVAAILARMGVKSRCAAALRIARLDPDA